MLISASVKPAYAAKSHAAAESDASTFRFLPLKTCVLDTWGHTLVPVGWNKNFEPCDIQKRNDDNLECVSSTKSSYTGSLNIKDCYCWILFLLVFDFSFKLDECTLHTPW